MKDDKVAGPEAAQLWRWWNKKINLVSAREAQLTFDILCVHLVIFEPFHSEYTPRIKMLENAPCWQVGHFRAVADSSINISIYANNLLPKSHRDKCHICSILPCSRFVAILLVMKAFFTLNLWIWGPKYI